MKNNIAVIGAGPAGCSFACFLDAPVTLFEQANPLKTLLYTGGGRCNLAHAEYDFKDLAKNYPRGEKFLYSVFSRFSTNETLKFFKEIGIETYVQNDNRIFPKSDSAKDVRNALLKKLKQNNSEIIREKITKISKKDKKFILNDKYEFEKVVIAVGGHAGYDLACSLGHKIVKPKPSLVGLISKEKFNLEGVSLTDITVKIKDCNKEFKGDLVFTKNGISGPLPYIISSLYARKDYNKTNPILLGIDFKIDNFVDLINKNGKKTVKNILSDYMPKSVAEYICKTINCKDTKGCDVNKDIRKKIEKYIRCLPVTVIGHENFGEVVTSGGVSLDEINPKTMQSKLVEGLYFCGEVIDVDGFCGGFNLQNAWSTAYVSAQSINSCYS